MPSTIRSKKNLIFVLMIVFVLLLAAAIRVGYIQLVKGEEYKERALSQQTTDITVEAERGIIYDRNGEKLAQSVKCYDIYVYPAEIGKYDTAKERKRLINTTARDLAKALDEDRDEVKSQIDRENGQVILAKGLTREEADKVRQLKLTGVTISPSTKREYPNGTLAANVIGMVNDENTG